MDNDLKDGMKQKLCSLRDDFLTYDFSGLKIEDFLGEKELNDIHLHPSVWTAPDIKWTELIRSRKEF